MEIKEIDISKIKPYEKNAKKHDKKQIENVAQSITEFGWQQPIVIDKNYEIIIGHCRFEAAKLLKLKTVPVAIADNLSDEQVRKLRIIDNKTNESEWDIENLKLELDELNFDEFNFDFGEINIKQDEKDIEAIEDDFDISAVSNEPKAKKGDIYKLGNHYLMCGDSTDKKDVETLLNRERRELDMIFTDPPYGMNLDTDFSRMQNHLDLAQEKGFTGGKKYDKGIVDDFNPKMLEIILNLNCKETFLWGADYFAELLPDKNKGSWIVWDKRANNNDNIEEDYSSDKMYGSCFELCWSRAKHKRDIARVKWVGVFGIEQEFDHKRYHPTQKPIKLCEWFIKRYSKENSNILDLFGGSGSTLIACEQLNRNCYMMELDEHYIDVIIARWEKMTGKKAVLISNNI